MRPSSGLTMSSSSVTPTVVSSMGFHFAVTWQERYGACDPRLSSG